MTILLWVIVFIASLYTLVKSSDYFVETAELFGKKMKIPGFIVGATIIAFGTSLPELATALSALFNHTPQVIISTVVGSNTANIFFILGVAILMAPAFVVSFLQQRIEFIFLLFITILLCVFVLDKQFTFIEGLISSVLLVGYVVYLVKQPKEEEDEGEELKEITKKMMFFFVLSGVGIWLGAEFTIEAIKRLSLIMGIPEQTIALTAVAMGTSLPELAVTVAAAKRGLNNIILGNIIGSNIFNSLCVMGIPSVVGGIGGLSFPVQGTIFNFGIPMMLLATVLLLVLSIMKKTPKYFGILFLLMYLFFVVGEFVGINLLEVLGIQI